MTHQLRLWQNLGFTPPPLLRPLAAGAEAVGLHGVTIPEHLVTPEQTRTPNPYVPDGGRGYAVDTPFLDPFVSIGALASVTERIRFMVNVYVLALRDLLVAARAIASAAVVSDERLVLGVGVGWLREEFEAAGVDFATRGARTDEMLGVLPALVSGRPVAHDGRFFRFDALRLAPAPASPVPVVVGGTADAALERAARHDGWVGVNFDLATLAGILDRLAEARRRVAPQPRDDYTIMVSSPPGLDERAVARLVDLGVTDLVLRPTTVTVGPDASVAEHLDAMRAAAELVRGART